MKVEKRDGSIVEFDKKLIENAIYKARTSVTSAKDKVSKAKAAEFAKSISKYFEEEEKLDIIPIEKIQDKVEDTLIKNGYINLAKAYIKYRRDHERMRESKSDLFKALYSKADATNVQNQNANVDEHSFGGRRGEVTNIIMERMALDMMSEKQRERFLNNEIYPHDKDSYYVGMHNCLSIPYDDLINDYGFDTKNTDVRVSNSANTAGQIVAVGGQLQTLQQFGGFSATHIDTTFVQPIRKTFYKNILKVREVLKKSNQKLPKLIPIINPKNIPIMSQVYWGKYGIFNKTRRTIAQIALEWTTKDMNQICEALYHNLNTLQSRSGRNVIMLDIA